MLNVVAIAWELGLIDRKAFTFEGVLPVTSIIHVEGDYIQA
jgi:hypothetical protein